MRDSSRHMRFEIITATRVIEKSRQEVFRACAKISCNRELVPVARGCGTEAGTSYVTTCYGDRMIRQIAPSRLVIFAIAFVCTLTPQSALAQPAVSGGFAVPIPVSSTESGVIGAGFWVEAAAPVSSRAGLFVGFDWATPYEAELQPSTRVSGIGRYQEIVLSTGVGIRLSATPRSEVAAVGGFGFGFVRVDETVRIASGGLGPAQTQRTRATRIAPSAIAGINVTAASNDRVGFVVRIHVRITDRGSASSRAKLSAVTFVPSAGVRFTI